MYYIKFACYIAVELCAISCARCAWKKKIRWQKYVTSTTTSRLTTSLPIRATVVTKCLLPFVFLFFLQQFPSRNYGVLSFKWELVCCLFDLQQHVACDRYADACDMYPTTILVNFRRHNNTTFCIPHWIGRMFPTFLPSCKSNKFT